MKTENKLKVLILQVARSWDKENERGIPEEFTSDAEVEAVYEVQSEDYALQDAEEQVREGEVVTNIEPEWSRHYESKSVAAKCHDGSWIGWTYWYGGGKHGNPEEIDWMSDVYELECEERQEMVTVRTFSKPAAKKTKKAKA